MPAGTRIGYIGEAEVGYLEDKNTHADDDLAPVDVDDDDVEVWSGVMWEAGDD